MFIAYCCLLWRRGTGPDITVVVKHAASSHNAKNITIFKMIIRIREVKKSRRLKDFYERRALEKQKREK